MKPFLYAAALVLLFACSTKLYIPNETNVNKRLNATVDEMVKGREIFSAKCGKCHKLPKPESRDLNQWINVMLQMAPKAKLSKEEHSLVLQYLANYN